MKRRGDDNKDKCSALRSEAGRLRRALNRLAPALVVLLRRRGFRIFKKEPADDALLPGKKHHARYYLMLHKYSFRLFLRDVIMRREGFAAEDVSRYAGPSTTREYIDILLAIGLVGRRATKYALLNPGITSFGATLEWYVAELCKREFGAEAVWGVKFRRPAVGGDYDVIARFGNGLFYIEVKSSPPKQIYEGEIAAFLDRVADLAPETAVFLMDTELRMKDKVVPMFEKELGKRFSPPPPVQRIERELFQIGNGVFIMNAKESIVRNMEAVIRRYYRRRLWS